jgi:hypothetical protein
MTTMRIFEFLSGLQKLLLGNWFFMLIVVDPKDYIEIFYSFGK